MCFSRFPRQDKIIKQTYRDDSSLSSSSARLISPPISQTIYRTIPPVRNHVVDEQHAAIGDLTAHHVLGQVHIWVNTRHSSEADSITRVVSLVIIIMTREVIPSASAAQEKTVIRSVLFLFVFFTYIQHILRCLRWSHR